VLGRIVHQATSVLDDRSAEIVGVFSDEATITRLVGAILLEQVVELTQFTSGRTLRME